MLLAKMEAVTWVQDNSEVFRCAFGEKALPVISLAFCDGFHWEVSKVKPLSCDELGICGVPVAWEPLLRQPLLNTRSFTAWQWGAMAKGVAAAQGMSEADVKKLSKDDRRSLVVGRFFATEPMLMMQVITKLASGAPPTVQDDDGEPEIEMDEECSGALGRFGPHGLRQL